MKRYLLIAMVAIFAFANDAQAQRRPRLFQKIKEDLFGAKQDSKQAEPSARKNQTAENNSTSNKYKNSAPRIPTPSRKPNDFRSNSIYNSGKDVVSRPTQALRSSAATKKQNTNKQSNRGFGFSVALDRDDVLVISSVDRDGNAAQKGIRRGDQLLEIGGFEATSVEEFEEIAKVMNAGDQMEFKIRRSGREKKIELLFGDIPEVEDVASATPSPVAPRYDFAPPSKSDSSRSVLSDQRQTSNRNAHNFSDQRSPDKRTIYVLNRTIEQQNRQIMQLQAQIRQLQSQRRSR